MDGDVSADIELRDLKVPFEHVVKSEKVGDKVVVDVDKRRHTAAEKALPIRSLKVLTFNIESQKISDMFVLARECRLCDTVGRFVLDSMKLFHKHHPSCYPRYKYLSAYTFFNGVAIEIGGMDEGSTLDEAGVCDRDWVFLIYNGVSVRTQRSIVAVVAEMIPYECGRISRFFDTVVKAIEDEEKENAANLEETEDEDPIVAYVKALTPRKRRHGSGESSVSQEANIGKLNIRSASSKKDLESDVPDLVDSDVPDLVGTDDGK